MNQLVDAIKTIQKHAQFALNTDVVNRIDVLENALEMISKMCSDLTTPEPRTWHLFPFNTEESATCWGTPILTVVSEVRPLEINHAMMAQIVFNAQNKDVHSSLTLEEMAMMTMEGLCEHMTDAITLNFNKCVVLPDDKVQLIVLCEMADRLLETAHDDTSAYNAAEVFANYLVNLAEGTVIDFPQFD
jgi:hypothetical protein